MTLRNELVDGPVLDRGVQVTRTIVHVDEEAQDCIERDAVVVFDMSWLISGYDGRQVGGTTG